jgi:hypothetical protein
MLDGGRISKDPVSILPSGDERERGRSISIGVERKKKPPSM